VLSRSYANKTGTAGRRPITGYCPCAAASALARRLHLGHGHGIFPTDTVAGGDLNRASTTSAATGRSAAVDFTTPGRSPAPSSSPRDATTRQGDLSVGDSSSSRYVGFLAFDFQTHGLETLNFWLPEDDIHASCFSHQPTTEEAPRWRPRLLEDSHVSMLLCFLIGPKLLSQCAYSIFILYGNESIIPDSI
jgi:hypothetical protein